METTGIHRFKCALSGGGGHLSKVKRGGEKRADREANRNETLPKG